MVTLDHVRVMNSVDFWLGLLNPILLLRTFYLAAAALVTLPSKQLPTNHHFQCTGKPLAITDSYRFQ